MQRHVKNYLEWAGSSDGKVNCEVCGAVAVDIHHVEPRSSFGSKRKDERDHISNLVALCRECHQMAHGPDSRKAKDDLKKIVNQRRKT